MDNDVESRIAKKRKSLAARVPSGIGRPSTRR